MTDILIIIFSYLSDDTLRQSVAPVSRLWLHTVQNVMVREVVWYSEWSPNRLSVALATLPGAGRFICHNQFTNHPAELLLLDALRQLEVDYQQQLNGCNNNNNQEQGQQDVSRSPAGGTTCQFFFHKSVPLQHLDLVTTKLSGTTFDQFPFPTSLTTINLTFCRGHWSAFSLTRILALCPLLESFHAKCRANIHLKITLEPLEQQQSSNTTTFGQHQQQQEDKQELALRSLILEGLDLDLAKLMILLTTTPHLKELKLIDMEPRWPRIWTDLLNYLPTLPYRLESTHFSHKNRSLSSSEMEAMLAVQAISSEWSLWGLNVQPSLLQSLESTTNVVTKLELHCSHHGSRWHQLELQSVPTLIHKYLCNSPHLVHLRVIRSAFLIKDMDLFGRRTFGSLCFHSSNPCNSNIVPDPAESSRKLEVWQCRNLKTLQFEINAHLDVIPMTDPVQSRIIFGYISRVCPNLEDLFITCPSVCVDASRRSYIPSLSLKLYGGICLLSRLRSLKRLRIEDYYLCQGPNCEVYEMNWIVPSGRDSWSRKKRQEEMSEWSSKETEETRLETERKAKGGLKKLTPASKAKEDVRLAKELQNLGLIVDVRNMVKEMDGYFSVACFPELERLSFEYPIDHRPRNELHRLFPKNSRLDGPSITWF
ncbi:hypothetical protein KI688_000683 [Linnemannia hyalina]|uniref:F-box domain-containing protein n=1 Tax=Linnemannia hyalina TaxID=64524 RepID=A0A9P7Y540_9FUNG|nr:hypothetical protein KI688_000683 [Linnemannia hyalina]